CLSTRSALGPTVSRPSTATPNGTGTTSRSDGIVGSMAALDRVTRMSSTMKSFSADEVSTYSNADSKLPGVYPALTSTQVSAVTPLAVATVSNDDDPPSSRWTLTRMSATSGSAPGASLTHAEISVARPGSNR